MNLKTFREAMNDPELTATIRLGVRRYAQARVEEILATQPDLSGRDVLAALSKDLDEVELGDSGDAAEGPGRA